MIRKCVLLPRLNCGCDGTIRKLLSSFNARLPIERITSRAFHISPSPALRCQQRGITFHFTPRQLTSFLSFPPCKLTSFLSMPPCKHTSFLPSSSLPDHKLSLLPSLQAQELSLRSFLQTTKLFFLYLSTLLADLSLYLP